MYSWTDEFTPETIRSPGITPEEYAELLRRAASSPLPRDFRFLMQCVEVMGDGHHWSAAAVLAWWKAMV